MKEKGVFEEAEEGVSAIDKILKIESRMRKNDALQPYRYNTSQRNTHQSDQQVQRNPLKDDKLLEASALKNFDHLVLDDVPIFRELGVASREQLKQKRKKYLGA